MGIKKILIIIFLIILCIFLIFKGMNTKSKETTFTFWTIQLKAPSEDLIQKNIDEFQKRHKEIKIVWVDIPISEAQKRAIAAILGKNPPDLINLNPEFSSLLAQKNALEFFNEEDAKEYNQSLVENLKYEGKIYALPFYATSAVTVLNKEKFKNCNVKLKTYDDILKLSECKNPPVFGIALNEGDVFSKILNKYGIGENNLDSYKTDEVYKKFKKMNDEGLLLKDTLTINHREGIEKYMAESAAFITAGSNFLTMIKQNAPNVYKTSVVYPQLTGEKKEYDVSVMNFVIPKYAKNKELAKEFINLILNEENQLEFAKKTNVLPANKKALNNSYFKNCGDDLIDKARCIAARQLDFPLKSTFGVKSKKEINEVVNNSLEVLFLRGEKEFDAKRTTGDIKNLISF